MSLREILNKLIADKTPILLYDGQQDWEAGILLEKLSEPMLQTTAHMQAGLYIAEINSKGYLGRILYRLKDKSPN